MEKILIDLGWERVHEDLYTLKFLNQGVDYTLHISSGKLHYAATLYRNTVTTHTTLIAGVVEEQVLKTILQSLKMNLIHLKNEDVIVRSTNAVSHCIAIKGEHLMHVIHKGSNVVWKNAAEKSLYLWDTPPKYIKTVI